MATAAIRIRTSQTLQPPALSAIASIPCCAASASLKFSSQRWHSRATASRHAVLSASGATALLKAIAPTIITSEPAMIIHRPELLSVLSSPNTRTPPANPDILGRVLLKDIADHPEKAAQKEPEKGGFGSRDFVNKWMPSSTENNRECSHRAQYVTV